jgi:hypothetical protein
VALFGRFGRGRDDGDGPGPGPAPGGSVDPGPGGRLGFGVSGVEEPGSAQPGPAVAPAPPGGLPSGQHSSSNQPRVAATEPRREVEPMPPSMLMCARCGHANSAGSRFCSNCGNPLAAAVDPRTGEAPAEMTSTMALGAISAENSVDTDYGDPLAAVVEGLSESNALLLVQRGPNAGSRFLLDAEVTSAGRAPDSDIFLDDVTVSRRHAEFIRAAQGFLVRDVGSHNGTYVNRQRIEEALLGDGDEVQIGKYRLVFLSGRR